MIILIYIIIKQRAKAHNQHKEARIMEKKIITAAKAAKKDGYEYITSVVGSKYHTTYHHVNTIDAVIKNGWDPAPRHYHGWRMGITTAQLPEKCINKTDAIAKYCD
jgi:hypothetical protein